MTRQADAAPTESPPTESPPTGRVQTGAVPIWSAPPHDRPASPWAFLRGEVHLPDPLMIIAATLRVTAASAEPARQFVATLWVNGSFVGVAPARSIGAESRVQELDVTALLRPGANAVAALAHTVEDQRFWAELTITTGDGVSVVGGTGPHWRALDGGSAYPVSGSIGTVYFAAPMEDLDARHYPYGFDLPGFDDSAWPPAVARDPFPELCPATTAALVLAHPEPIAVQRVDGVYRIDFGRTWVGGLRLSPTGSSGDVWELRFGQVRDPGGQVVYATGAGNTYRDRWTIDGSGRPLQTWGLRVFRHVDVLGAPAGLTAADLTAQAYLYPFDRSEADFACDDDRLTTLWRLSRDTIEATNLDLYVDSWERERAPYEADAYLQLRAHLALSADARLARYSVDFLLQRRTWPTEWPLYLVLAVGELYRQTGDLDHVERCYDDLVTRLPDRWLDPHTGLVTKRSGSDSRDSTTDADLVDWPVAERDGYVFGPVNTVVNALAHSCYVVMADLARELGRTDDADRWHLTADRLRTAINARLWDQAAGTYADGLDVDGNRIGHHATHAALFPLAFGVVPAHRRESVVAHLAPGLACSVYAAAFEIEALVQHGHTELALTLLTADTLRSFASMIGTGTGATMEAWHPTLKPNTTYSHPWSAWPAYLLPQGILGLRPTAPGWTRFEIRPALGPLVRARALVPTPYGGVQVAVEQQDDVTVITADVPAGTTAVLRTDRQVGHGDRAPTTLGPGRHRIRLVRPGR